MAIKSRHSTYYLFYFVLKHHIKAGTLPDLRYHNFVLTLGNLILFNLVFFTTKDLRHFWQGKGHQHCIMRVWRRRVGTRRHLRWSNLAASRAELTTNYGTGRYHSVSACAQMEHNAQGNYDFSRRGRRRSQIYSDQTTHRLIPFNCSEIAFDELGVDFMILLTMWHINFKSRDQFYCSPFSFWRWPISIV